jgi:shikimate kinase
MSLNLSVMDEAQRVDRPTVIDLGQACGVAPPAPSAARSRACRLGGKITRRRAGQDRMRAVLGIAGPSGSGKTTVGRLVADAAGAELLQLDHYWLSGIEKPIVNRFPSRERPCQYDGARLAADAERLARGGTPVVAEGFLLFAYPQCVALCGTRVFLDVPWDAVSARRRARALAARANRVREAGFRANGRAEWERWGAFQATLPGVAVLDGTAPAEAIAERVLALWRADSAGPDGRDSESDVSGDSLRRHPGVAPAGYDRR